MKSGLLLDTHVVIQLLSIPEVVPEVIRSYLTASKLRAVVSAASIWEISIKSALGKLKLPKGFHDALADLGFEDLDITSEHARGVAELSPIHGDPFDRILISQAKCEGLSIVTNDAIFKEYDVPVEWG